ncbi:YKR051W [Zygosaccharomyces parabailii]|nr:YKR051W [Zygosaccharomyces parabailii]
MTSHKWYAITNGLVKESSSSMLAKKRKFRLIFVHIKMICTLIHIFKVKSLWHAKRKSKKRTCQERLGGYLLQTVLLMPEAVQLPWWWQKLCVVSTVSSLVITVYAITMHFLNYRMPYEQRLVIRIQLIVPVFAVTSLAAVKSPHLSQVYLDPFKEVYEAFVIYTFFSLLVLVLGGERRIITELSLDNPPSTQVIPLLSRYMRKIDLSYPADFLMVKIGILQYVWFKPFYCIANLVCLFHDLPQLSFALVMMYNISVTWSLCNLAVFWRCLHNELRPFNPWGKFLCVKVVIFASYWQEMVMMLLGSKGILHGGNAGFVYQNGMLCVEMIGVALLHFFTFPWNEYSSKRMPHCGRMNYLYALRDCFGCRDLKWDFTQTIMGNNYYNCRNFDPTTESALVAKMNVDSKMRRINQGMRFENQGLGRYWVKYGSTDNVNERHFAIHEPWDDSIAGYRYIPCDTNYPVSSDLPADHRNSRSIHDLRRDINSRAPLV